jgi:hypothetical protein
MEAQVGLDPTCVYTQELLTHNSDSFTPEVVTLPLLV